MGQKDNFSDFLFAFQKPSPFRKRSILKETNLIPWSNFLTPIVKAGAKHF